MSCLLVTHPSYWLKHWLRVWRATHRWHVSPHVTAQLILLSLCCSPLQVLGSFFYGYLVTQIFGGYLARRFGGKWVLGTGVFITTALTVATPFAARASIASMIFLRVLEGIGEGVTYPAMHAIWYALGHNRAHTIRCYHRLTRYQAPWWGVCEPGSGVAVGKGYPPHEHAIHIHTRTRTLTPTHPLTRCSRAVLISGRCRCSSLPSFSRDCHQGRVGTPAGALPVNDRVLQRCVLRHDHRAAAVGISVQLTVRLAERVLRHCWHRTGASTVTSVALRFCVVIAAPSSRRRRRLCCCKTIVFRDVGGSVVVAQVWCVLWALLGSSSPATCAFISSQERHFIERAIRGAVARASFARRPDVPLVVAINGVLFSSHRVRVSGVT